MQDSNANVNQGVVRVIAALIVIAVFALVAYLIYNGAHNNSTGSSKNTQSAMQGNSSKNPAKLSAADLSLSGEEFAKKYTDQYIEFDGLIQGTSTISGAKSSHSALLYGDDLSKGSFADTSIFTITAIKSTFGAGLEQFASDNDSPYKTGQYPKVHVVARVTKFDSDRSWVELEPIVNADGATPSVTLR